MKSASLPRGVEAVRCWCGDLCKVKEVEDFSDWLGMKFFMCANYESDPPECISAYIRPPVCSSHPDYCLLDIIIYLNLIHPLVSFSSLHVLSLD